MIRLVTAVFTVLAVALSAPAERPRESMVFEMRPEKTTVYTGEPLRVDVRWETRLPANRVRSLDCVPALFNRSDVQVVVPRCLAPENQQVGLPFGGRRVIARRAIPEDDATALGTIRFPFYLRFTDPGVADVPAVELTCALLQGRGTAFAPYASYYNNGLFEPLSSLDSHDRVRAVSKPFSIRVLPLPSKGRSETFSGLFANSSIDVSISTDRVVVGQVLELELRVHTDAPHGMLDLPPLTLQPSLRARFRVAPEYGRKWYADGTGFRARIRPLTTRVAAVPSMRFEVFDTATARYRFINTPALPLTVLPDEGRHYFDVKTLPTASTLTDGSTGIWHNADPGRAARAMNAVVGYLADHFVVLMLVGPVLFLCLLPWVLDLRRRAGDPVYLRLIRAYRTMRRCPEGTSTKWESFRVFLAAGFARSGEAWTSGDAAEHLKELGITEEEIDFVLAVHHRADAADFSTHQPTTEIPALNPLAKRLFRLFRRALPCFFALSALNLSSYATADWSRATNLFRQAMQAEPGLPQTASLFKQSALEFEAAARQNQLPGEAWYNAGNAWLKTGEVGRSIACYRQAIIYRPFDRLLRANLKTARALTIDAVKQPRSLGIRDWPQRSISAFLVCVSFLFWVSLLVHARLRTRFSFSVSTAFLLLVLTASVSAAVACTYSGTQGVLITAEVYGRKGPSYSYDSAFEEPLHDGLEFHLLEQRAGWQWIELADGRRCWVPGSLTRTILNEMR